MALALTLLDSENNRQAEMVYYEFFDIDLDKAESIAVDKHQTGNVRFYASCRIADLLSNQSDAVRKQVLKKVSGSSEFRTGFGGTNRLTCGFFTPNGPEGPYFVEDVVSMRLNSIEKKSVPSK